MVGGVNNGCDRKMKWPFSCSSLLVFAFTFWSSITLGATDRVGSLPSPEEVASVAARFRHLPEFCQVKLTAREFHVVQQRAVPESLANLERRWEQIMGKRGYNVLHHYCWGIQKLSDAVAAPEETEEHIYQKRGKYRSAVSEFDYVRRGPTQDFPLLPELLVNQAQGLAALGELDRGIQNLMEVIEIRPDYVAAYLHLSRLLRDSGRGGDAVEVLRLGFKRTGGSLDIERELQQGGGGAGSTREPAPTPSAQ